MLKKYQPQEGYDFPSSFIEDLPPANRFMLFSGDNYYPGGGFNDHRGSYPTLDAAKNAFNNLQDLNEWAHIVLIAVDGSYNCVWEK